MTLSSFALISSLMGLPRLGAGPRLLLLGLPMVKHLLLLACLFRVLPCCCSLFGAHVLSVRSASHRSRALHYAKIPTQCLLLLFSASVTYPLSLLSCVHLCTRLCRSVVCIQLRKNSCAMLACLFRVLPRCCSLFGAHVLSVRSAPHRSRALHYAKIPTQCLLLLFSRADLSFFIQDQQLRLIIVKYAEMRWNK